MDDQGVTLTVVGRSVPRVDAPAKVTGASRYVDDLVLPGMLYARLARSIEAHAEIERVGDEAARELPGVVEVLSSVNFADRFGTLPPYDPACHDFERPEPFLPEPGDVRVFNNVVRYVGEPVAAVVAETDAVAKRAATLLDIDYRTRPAVFDVDEARRDGAPLLHDDAQGNLAFAYLDRDGDVDAALASAAVVVEHRFTTSKQKQAQLEPTCCVAEPAPGGGVNVYAPLQSPHRARHTLAHLFGLRLSQVRVVPPAIGGAFGKGDALTAEPYAVALALATGRPVKLRYSRNEDFVGTESRHPSAVSVTMGFAADGTIVALRARGTLDAGAYRSHSPRLAPIVVKQMTRPYAIHNVDMGIEVVFTNTPVSGAFRGYGGPQAAFPLEQAIDMGAEALGMDPLELRIANLTRADREDPGSRASLLEVIRQGREAIGWDAARRAGPGDGTVRRGVGMAAVTWKSGVADKPGALDQSGARVLVNDDGSVDVVTAACDLGTGVSTTLAQVAADALGVPLDGVRVTAPDTASTPFDSGAFASRTLYRTGEAVQRAATQAREKILAYAGEQLEAEPGDLELTGGRVSVRGAPRRGVELHTLLLRGLFEGRDFSGQGQTPISAAPTSAAQFAEVEVDTETGQTRVLRLVAVQDVGRAINPAIVEGQIQGAAHQGLGYAMAEDLVVDRSTGTALTGSFMDYRLLTVADGPLIEPIMVEHPDPSGPFGAKGAGEPSIILTAPAVANAIRAATGVTVADLPMTAEAVHRALREASPADVLIVSIRVLGVSASPRRGNTSILVQAALMGAATLPGTETQFVSLAGRSISVCNGCGPCRAAGHCVIDDDMQPLYDELLRADAVILGTPVYYGLPTGLAKAFMERVQGLGVGEKKLRLKIGGAIATGASRNGGQETALMAVNIWYHICEMLPVGITAPVSQWGATGFTGADPLDAHRDATELKLAPHTVTATQMAWMYGRKIATVAQIVTAGVAASGLDLPDTPYGYSLPQDFPPELDQIEP